jgi:hypothetical protein
MFSSWQAQADFIGDQRTEKLKEDILGTNEHIHVLSCADSPLTRRANLKAIAATAVSEKTNIRFCSCEGLKRKINNPSLCTCFKPTK